jgi:hypothetical protein
MPETIGRLFPLELFVDLVSVPPEDNIFAASHFRPQTVRHNADLYAVKFQYVAAIALHRIEPGTPVVNKP